MSSFTFRTRLGIHVAAALMAVAASQGCSSSDSPDSQGDAGSGGQPQVTAGKGGAGQTGTGGAGQTGSAGAGGTTDKDAGVDMASPSQDTSPPDASNTDAVKPDASAADTAKSDTSLADANPDVATPDAAPADALPANAFIIDVTTFSIDNDGKLTEVGHTSAMKPNDAPLIDDNGVDVAAAEIRLSPNGKFLYTSIRDGSNIDETKHPRTYNVIAAFKVEAQGKLTLIEHEDTGGARPRGFAIDPSGKWLIAANYEDANLRVFEIGEDGALTKKHDVTMAGDANIAGIATATAGPSTFLFTQSGNLDIKSWRIGNDGALTGIDTLSTPYNSCTSYLTVNPTRQQLYAANDCGQTVSSYNFDINGNLMARAYARSVRTSAERKADTAHDTDLGGPVFVDVHRSGSLLISANYGGGVFMYRIAGNGDLTVLSNQFVGWATHNARFHPTKDVVYAISKDQQFVAQYSLNAATGALTALTPPTLSTGFRNPRHMTISADGKYAYVINERSFFQKH